MFCETPALGPTYESVLSRASLGSSNPEIFLHSAPVYSDSANLKKIDELVKSTLIDVINVDVTGAAWEQASLPLRYGGLGIRSVDALALPCFLASLHAAAPLIAAISPSVTDVTPAALPPALEEFKRLIGSGEVPNAPENRKQRVWDDLACELVRDKLLEAANQIDRAHLLAASEPHTAAWLQAVPVQSLGLHLDADTVRVAVALRLGAPVSCKPHSCRQCGRPANRLGHHGLSVSCIKSAGRFSRHANLNDVVKRALSGAGLSSVLEPQGLDRGDERRPDGLTLFLYNRGKSLAWDATCVDTFGETTVVRNSLEPGSAAKAAETKKTEVCYYGPTHLRSGGG